MARGITSPHAAEEIDEARISAIAFRLRNMRRLMDYIQNMFVRLFQCKTQSSCTDVLDKTSLWIRQARCMLQS